MTTERIERLEALSETILLALDQLRQRQEVFQQQLQQQQEGMAGAIETLIQTVDEVSRETAIDRAEMKEFRATTGAALERIDRVMDYLIRRDGERGTSSNG
ncbi:hypothetical protein NDA01_24735 [Trichocoleus desertorum AS-A10]|uniref:hypothetical protein n=1 Tax=Trichocoleus desertorum TaxID=1481672 RepID=UPI003299FE3E